MIKKCSFMMALLSVSAIALANEQTVVGKAYDIDTGKLLYLEQHRYLKEESKGMRHEVRYLDPDGQQIAYKVLNYQHSEQAPEFEQSNALRGEWIKVTEPKQGELEVQYREKSDSVVFDKTFKRTDHLLVDAGFDRYVKNNWQALNTANKLMKIDYLVPSRQTTIGFQVSKAECLPDTPEPSVCFSLAPQSWWVSLAVDPIIVAYEPNSHNLLRFSGRGNIASQTGKYQSVDIYYQYPTHVAHN